jgi:hypothetical protein
VISWFGLTGSSDTLAVVNVHAINFSLSVESYTQQMRAIGDALATHTGPVIFAGDFNTWSAARTQVVADVAQRLGLEEIKFAEDKRTLFFGKQLDHILVRGLRVVSASAIPVTSSDHNPVTEASAIKGRRAQWPEPGRQSSHMQSASFNATPTRSKPTSWGSSAAAWLTICTYALRLSASLIAGSTATVRN